MKYQRHPFLFQWPDRIPRRGPGIYLCSWQAGFCLFGWRLVFTWREKSLTTFFGAFL